MTAGLRQFPAFFRDKPGDRKEAPIRPLFVEQHKRGRRPQHPLWVTASHTLGTPSPACLGSPASPGERTPGGSADLPQRLAQPGPVQVWTPRALSSSLRNSSPKLSPNPVPPTPAMARPPWPACHPGTHTPCWPQEVEGSLKELWPCSLCLVAWGPKPVGIPWLLALPGTSNAQG